jgi:3-methylcrotonyl-CoA carboxylase beta subunit
MSFSRTSNQALRLTRRLPNASPSSSTTSSASASLSAPAFSHHRRHARAVASLTPPHQAAAISRIQTAVDPSSDEFRENHRQMTVVMDKVQELSRKIQRGGPEKARAKHLARNKMLPRDRVTALIDPGTTFLELSPFAGHELYPEADVPAAGIITGIGIVEGVTCVIVANDSTVKGGTYYPITVKKHLRAQAVAQENKLP